MENKQEFNNNDSDEEISKKHSQLLESIGKLDRGQRIKKVERSEPTLQVSEFHLVNSGITDNDAVCVDELVKKLGGRTHHKDISKKFKIAKRQVSVLSKPLEKPAADKLKRVVGFENTTKELEKWNAIVTRNRIASNQVFPLKPSPLETKSTKDFVKTFRVQSELEKELVALEPKTPDENGEKTDEFSLTLEEILQKRLEAAKFRAQQSYKHAKAHRMKKIKSKKFHRIERNAKAKEQLKEFAKLQKVDPQAALDKLEQLNKARAEERMSLKHKSTSQWAKNKQIRAKYDKESRAALAQQLSISRELMQKVDKQNNSDDEVMENDSEALKLHPSATNNPWINTEKTASEIDEFVLGYRKYWEKKHEADMKKKIEERESVNNKDKSVACESVPKKDSQLSIEKIVASENTSEKVVQQHLNTKKQYSNDSSTSKSCKKKKMNRVTTSESDNGKSSSTKVAANDKIISNSASKKDSNVVEKAGTSEWTIEIIDNMPQSTNHRVTKTMGIDEIFDTVDDKINQKFERKLRKVKRKLSEIPKENVESSNNSNCHVTDLSFKKMKLRPELDAALDETVGQSTEQDSTVASIDESAASKTSLKDKFSISKNSTAEIDPNDFINVKSQHLKNAGILNNKTNGNDILHDGNENNDWDESIGLQNIITEAFADDDVIDEFKKEKMDEIEKSRADNIVDARLPGWGSWGGTNIKQSMKKKRKFIMKFPQNSERNDENKGNVILIQDNSVVKKHQVNDLPYPFSSVSDFETSIRAPIGRDFIPENAHKRLIEPAVKTKMGKVIEPMSKHFLIEKKNTKLNGKLLQRPKNRVTKQNNSAK